VLVNKQRPIGMLFHLSLLLTDAIFTQEKDYEK